RDVALRTRQRQENLLGRAVEEHGSDLAQRLRLSAAEQLAEGLPGRNVDVGVLGRAGLNHRARATDALCAGIPRFHLALQTHVLLLGLARERSFRGLRAEPRDVEVTD